MILAGEINGARVNLGLFDRAGTTMLDRTSYPITEIPDLLGMVADFLGGHTGDSIAAGCFSVSGAAPKNHAASAVSNLPWPIDTDQLRSRLHIGRVTVINNLLATAEGIDAQGPGELRTLQTGALDHEPAIRLLLVAGAELGMALLVRQGKHWQVNPSAGGQAALAPRNEHEIRLLRFFRRKYPYHVSIDRALSWRGLLRIYHYLLEMDSNKPATDVRRSIEEDPDGAPALISRNGVYKTCPVCAEAVALYVGLFGAMAGNMALSVMATGGVFIAGSIPPRILPSLTDGAFVNAFGAKGSSAELLRDIPVHVIVDPEVALLGAARRAAREARR